jgi:hypothetical protein
MRSIILFIYINILSIFLMTKNTFCDLASLHYVIFIKPIVVSLSETLCFDSKQFTNTSINKLIEAKPKTPFMLFETHFFTNVLVYRKSNGIQFEDLMSEDLRFFTKP